MNKSWLSIKNKVLGKNYDLSVFFLPGDQMSRLNKIYRKKDYAANVLSFPLEKNSGEILLNKIYRGKNYADYLFIHSLLHLKGLKHGQKMDRAEIKIMREIHPENWEKIINTSFKNKNIL